VLRKRTQYSLKNVVVLALLAAGGCQEKPIDQGALLTARTVGLAQLERGQLAEAEQEFKTVISLAPKDASGHANLGLTYLRANRLAEAESELKRARKLDARSPEVALILARLYVLTKRPDDATRALADIEPDARVLYTLAQIDRQTSGDTVYSARLRQLLEKVPSNLAVRVEIADVFLRLGENDSTLRYLEDTRRLRPEPPPEAQPHLAAAIDALRSGRAAAARAAFDRFRHAIEVTSPYQAALALVNWTEGPIAGNQTFAFSPQTLITMRGIRPPPTSVDVRFTDVTNESGLPELDAAPTALALGDYDGDGVDNLLLSAGGKVRLFAMQQGFMTEATDRMPLPMSVGATDATFVDYDNDGWLDLFAIGTDQHGYLLRNNGGQRFEDVTPHAGVREVGGARHALFLDLDHDGDLDLLLVGNESTAAYRNNADGTFAPFPNAAGLQQGGSDAGFADVDDDGRTDVVIASVSGTHGLFLNDAVRGFTRSADTIHGAGPVAVGDYDNDGAVDFYVGGSGLWHNNGSGTFTRTATPSREGGEARFFDYDNDGWLDLLLVNETGVSLLHNNKEGRFEDRSTLLPKGKTAGPILISDLDGDGDLDILLGGRFLRNDGGNAHLGMRIQLTALRTGSSKNNTFGIGSTIEIRSGELYQTRVVTDRLTQIGLGTHLKADVLRVQWTNGVPQTIYFPGSDADVLELQQLKGSCAFLYAWDGKQYRFITDIMWQSALGMPVGIMGKRETGNGKGGEMSYAPAAASLEYVRIPGEALKPKEGRYSIQVTEELWETAYLDQLRLLAVDHPDSVEVFVDERFPPMRGPELRLFQVVRRRAPLSAVDDRGTDVLDELRDNDFRYVSNLTPLRYQGLTEPHALVLDLDADAGKPGTHLFLRGWVFPSDASINVALAQQHALKSEMPVLEVRDARGQWVSRGMIGFPAGKDKTMVIDLDGIFPTKDHHVRVRTNMQVYWDQAFVGEGLGAGSWEMGKNPHFLAPISADLHFRGFSRMYRRGGQYGPHWFDYQDVTTQSPWRPISGAATRFGDVRPLLDDSDDRYIVMVPGDETTVEFDATQAKALPAGWTRTFFLYSDGWIKDSDLNTAYGTTVEPLPYHAIKSYPYGPGEGYPADSARQRYVREYNTRIIKRSPGVREER
jgi:Tfp pilus assembly protein PilF